MSIDNLLQKLASPAQRALLGAGITTLEQLSQHSEQEILALHGIGKNALQIIQAALKDHGLALKKNQ
jgi:DNA-directed RNA polymerase alpha subunit